MIQLQVGFQIARKYRLRFGEATARRTVIGQPANGPNWAFRSNACYLNKMFASLHIPKGFTPHENPGVFFAV